MTDQEQAEHVQMALGYRYWRTGAGGGACVRSTPNGYEIWAPMQAAEQWTDLRTYGEDPELTERNLKQWWTPCEEPPKDAPR